MKKSALLFLIFTLILLIPTKGITQNPSIKDSLETKIKSAAKEIMKDANTCALITLDKDGFPIVRMMDPFLPENDFTVWLATNPNSRKASQIKKNPKVSLYYVEQGSAGYVMLQGNAELINDPEEKVKRWKEGWEAFYPNKLEDYLLIKVTPLSMEVASYNHNLLGDPKTWGAPKVIFD